MRELSGESTAIQQVQRSISLAIVRALIVLGDGSVLQ